MSNSNNSHFASTKLKIKKFELLKKKRRRLQELRMLKYI